MDELPESTGEEGREDSGSRNSEPQTFHSTARSKGTLQVVLLPDDFTGKLQG